MVADCARSKLPGEVVVSRLLPLKTGGFCQSSVKYRPNRVCFSLDHVIDAPDVFVLSLRWRECRR